MNKNARMDFRIPVDLKHQIGQYAETIERSKAYIIIEALKMYLSTRDSDQIGSKVARSSPTRSQAQLKTTRD